MKRRGEAPARPAGALPPADGLARLAATTFALSASHDLAALVDVCGEAARDAAGGRHWRFLALDPDSGALHDGAPDGPLVPVTPGGPLDRLLRDEAPWLGPAQGVAAGAAAPPPCLLGLPVRSGAVLRGLLLVGLDAAPAGGVADPGLVAARIAADQCALALERGALERELACQRERMQRLESRAHAGEELFSELISVVAHEIRTPLTSIKAYTETLIDAPADEFERRRDFLHVIDEECDRLARLVGDALDLSRLEAGLRLLKVRPLSPRALLEDLALTIEPDAQRHGLTLRVEGDDAPDEVEADGDLVKQLLLNLVGNAIKFSPRGTTVTLRAEGGGAGEGGDWRLAVIDQGSGIPEDQLERIFERFYRIETRDGGRAPGTGLGLAIARHIADLHGGHLGVENGAAGGSIFSVRLPRRQLAPAPLREVARALVERAEAREVLGAAVDMVSEVMAAEIVSILLVDPDAGDLFIAAARGLDPVARARRIHFRSGVAGAVLAAGRPVLVENIETDGRFGGKNHPQYSTKSLLCAPIEVGGVHVGVINVNNKRSREEFGDEDLARLVPLVARLSAALSRAHAHPDAPGVFSEARAWVRSAARVEGDLRLGGPELFRHARRVAARLGPDGANADATFPLSSAEGASPWNGGGADRAAARAVLLARGERLDGSGWPAGRSGAEVPLAARIVAVLDAFAGLTQGRPHRAALTAGEAMAALRADAGRRFDGAAVEALAASLAEDGWECDGGGGAGPRREEAA